MRKDVIGQKFNRWTVVSKGSPKKVFCRCDCGTLAEVDKWTVVHGTSKSCGCYLKEVMSKINLTHGRSRTPEYGSWLAMKKRCTDENYGEFKYYGGRGISICDRWKKFENFIADMGIKPSPIHSIDRINNDGNYEPSNCRWATPSTQTLNQRLLRKTISGHRGVTLERTTGKWRARIKILGKPLIDGLFHTIEEAVEARQIALKKYYEDCAMAGSV
jgi:hypothetical protein